MRFFLGATVLAASLSLSSCGGGSGGSSGAPNATTSTPTPTTTPSTSTSTSTNNDTPDLEADSTDEETSSPRSAAALRIDPEFDMKSSWQMSVEVDLPGIDDAFFSLCSSYADTNQGFDVDYASCIVRSPISNGTFDGSIEVSNQFDSLIGALIYYDEFASPEYHVFPLENGQPVIRWD